MDVCRLQICCTARSPDAATSARGATTTTTIPCWQQFEQAVRAFEEKR